MQCDLPIPLWGYSIIQASYIMNMLPSRVTKNLTPYELLYSKPTTYDKLKTFGCLCHSTCLVKENKFSSRANQCIQLGISPTQKGFVLYDIIHKRILVSRDVQFYDDIFPMLNPTKATSKPSPSSLVTSSMSEEDPIIIDGDIPPTENLQPPFSPPPFMPKGPTDQTQSSPPNSNREQHSSEDHVDPGQHSFEVMLAKMIHAPLNLMMSSFIHVVSLPIPVGHLEGLVLMTRSSDTNYVPPNISLLPSSSVTSPSRSKRPKKKSTMLKGYFCFFLPPVKALQWVPPILCMTTKHTKGYQLVTQIF